MVPADGSISTEENLNSFLRSHKVIAVKTEFSSKDSLCWCFLIEYVPTLESSSNTSKVKIDYMHVLPAEEFAIFSKLRNFRKSLAEELGLPPFAVFTDEQLASIVKTNPKDLKEFGTISGIGSAKIEKYGTLVLSLLQTDEKSKEPF